MEERKVSRRVFLVTSTATLIATGAMAQKRTFRAAGYKSPNEKLNVAAIGAGGKGASDIDGCNSENIVALCDPDFKTAAKTFSKYPNAKQYKDFRVMFDKERNIDAVTIATPDHSHAVAAMWAMESGAHVYVQKPLTHDIYEARRLTEAARKYKVASQMGNQGHWGEGTRKLCEMIWSGVIGNVTEVHAWTNRPIWPQGITEPLPAEPLPEYMDWDVWLGPAANRPYNSNYAPFKWRGWYDFGCGAIGDMACHILDPANWALQLGHPVSVECINQEGKNPYTYPTKSTLRYDFPSRGSMPPVSIYWYDGGLFPPRPAGIPADCILGDKPKGDNGSVFIGERGVITTGTYGEGTRLIPDEKMKEYEFPSQVLTRSPGHYRDWIRACKGGAPACSNFDYSGPFTEWVLLGPIALRHEGKLMWDGPRMKITNVRAANEWVRRPYRKGWRL